MTQGYCNVCHTPWVPNGPGVPDCACTLAVPPPTRRRRFVNLLHRIFG